jgi:hypothetical protein
MLLPEARCWREAYSARLPIPKNKALATHWIGACARSINGCSTREGRSGPLQLNFRQRLARLDPGSFSIQLSCNYLQLDAGQACIAAARIDQHDYARLILGLRITCSHMGQHALGQHALLLLLLLLTLLLLAGGDPRSHPRG